ncbi:hypothetical protein [Microbulbifer taiwanensis]|uniref:Uncharacterized protein n=1 Tax=Microbulbifer taiwanensis TaxID=986746 RepID=A0ABW1YGU8_9GAMM|nr:hypothetical protein [Microbulbifer taiwanensis]
MSLKSRFLAVALSLMVSLSVVLAVPALADSKAAQWLVSEQIEAGCGPGVKGRFGPGFVIERDLTGDGRKDLIISHEGLTCADNRSRSQLCGAAMCSWNIYVREGDLLVEKKQMLGSGVSVGGGATPSIVFSGKSSRHSLKWNGSNFQ